MPEIIADFTVDGNPEPKGSWTPIVRGGRVVMLPARRGEARKRYEVWVRDVTAAAKVWQLTHRRALLDDEPLRVELGFFMPRPPSVHKRVLFPIRRFDADKLARLVLDCLTKGGLIADDARIVDLIVSKRFAGEKGPHARIIVSSLLERAA
jgi:Holliday junction resolvase RusA-like endonuclease